LAGADQEDPQPSAAAYSSDERAVRPVGYRVARMRRRGLALTAVLAAVAAVFAAWAAGAREREARSSLSIGVLARGFDTPVLATAPRSEPRNLYVVEQGGRIIKLAGGRRTVFLDVRRAVTAGGEQGLLGLAFHPRYPRDRRIFVAYTSAGGQNVVAEYRVNPARTRVLTATRRILFAVDDPYGNHNGGHVAFGRDGFLYSTIGDGGAGGDPENRAQDPGSPFGKLLRFDVNRRPARAPVFAALGLRNAWRFSFDRANGDLYLGDVGQGEIEEIDYTPNPSPGTENYEWDVREGSRSFEDKAYGPGNRVGPVAEYTHADGCSVTGGHVYRGTSVRAAVGRYFYGDYCSGIVWSLRMNGGRATDVRREPFQVASLSSFGETPAGELLLVSHDGTIYRLRP
jgi:glucose/arabinose dehydrogenase